MMCWRNCISVIAIIISVLLISCEKKDGQLEQVKRLYAERGIVFDKEIETCLVLPEVGCGGCIAGGVNFLLDNKEKFSSKQKKNIVMLTAIHSKKLLYRNLEINSPDELNCIIDSGNKYLVKGHNKLYPMVLKLDNGNIESVEFQSPETDHDVFESLKL